MTNYYLSVTIDTAMHYQYTDVAKRNLMLLDGLLIDSKPVLAQIESKIVGLLRRINEKFNPVLELNANKHHNIIRVYTGNRGFSTIVVYKVIRYIDEPSDIEFNIDDEVDPNYPKEDFTW